MKRCSEDKAIVLLFEKKPLLSLRDAKKMLLKKGLGISLNIIWEILQRSGIKRNSTVIIRKIWMFMDASLLMDLGFDVLHSNYEHR